MGSASAAPARQDGCPRRSVVRRGEEQLPSLLAAYSISGRRNGATRIFPYESLPAGIRMFLRRVRVPKYSPVLERRFFFPTSAPHRFVSSPRSFHSQLLSLSRALSLSISLSHTHTLYSDTSLSPSLSLCSSRSIQLPVAGAISGSAADADGMRSFNLAYFLVPGPSPRSFRRIPH